MVKKLTDIPLEFLWILCILHHCMMRLVLSTHEPTIDLNNEVLTQAATHAKVAYVSGSVFCEQCFDGSHLAVSNQLKTPLAGAQVMLQCNSSNEAGQGSSHQSIGVTNNRGGFKLPLSLGYYHKNGAAGCSVRLLQSPHAKCTSKLNNLEGELSYKPDEKPSAASCKLEVVFSGRKRRALSVSGKNQIHKGSGGSLQTHFVNKYLIFSPLIPPPLPPLFKPPPFPLQLPPFPPLPTLPPFPFPLPPHHPFPGHPIPPASPSSPPSPTPTPPTASPPAPTQPSPYAKPPPIVPTTPPLPPLVPTKPPPLVPTNPPLPPYVPVEPPPSIPTNPPTYPTLPPLVPIKPPPLIPTKPPLPPSSHPLPPLPPHHPLPLFPPHPPIALPPLPPKSPIVLPPFPPHPLPPLPYSPPSPSLPNPLPPPKPESPPKTLAPPLNPYQPSPPSPP